MIVSRTPMAPSDCVVTDSTHYPDPGCDWSFLQLAGEVFLLRERDMI